MEALRTNLLWRVKELPCLKATAHPSFFRCLPSDVVDPFGHPIVILKLSEVVGAPGDLRMALLRCLELLRHHLASLNHHQNTINAGHTPKLQYVALLDIDGLSFSSVVRPSR